jgi:hypothetical protein
VVVEWEEDQLDLLDQLVQVAVDQGKAFRLGWRNSDASLVELVPASAFRYDSYQSHRACHYWLLGIAAVVDVGEGRVAVGMLVQSMLERRRETKIPRIISQGRNEKIRKCLTMLMSFG